MTENISQDEKEVFKRASERRKENGIKLKRICMLAEEGQVEAFNIVWEEWVRRYRKMGAVDLLIRCISAGEAAIQDEIRARKEKKRAKKRPASDRGASVS